MSDGQSWAAEYIGTAGSRSDRIHSGHGDSANAWCPSCDKKTRYYDDHGNVRCWVCDELAALKGECG